MPMQRALTYVFLALLALVQYPLWLGKGGWLRAWDLDRQVTGQRKVNDDLKRRNAGMEAEVRDLKQGVGAIEERARYELGMVKDDEVFFQVLDAPAPSGMVGSAPLTIPAPAVAGAAISAPPASATPKPKP
jgi:cell division protein FtsB